MAEKKEDQVSQSKYFTDSDSSDDTEIDPQVIQQCKPIQL